MKVKHRLTGEELKLSCREWEDKYIAKKLEDLYDIIDQDVVLVRQITPDGKRKEYKNFDREVALKMVTSNPMNFDFIDIDGGKIENGKRVEIENPKFKVINEYSWSTLSSARKVIVGILISGLGGLLSYYLIQLFN